MEEGGDKGMKRVETQEVGREIGEIGEIESKDIGETTIEMEKESVGQGIKDDELKL